MTKITVARGDGIGPDIMDACLRILKAAGAKIEIDEIEVGEKAYLAGHLAGIAPSSWETIRRNKIFLKAPITTPQGGGYKSLNVTIRKSLGLFANVRPCRSYFPYVDTKHPQMDVIVIRENEEDLYGGIEHQQTQEVVQCLKLVSRPGSEKIIRFAFEYAQKYERKKLSCFTKDNIMKQTDGLFHSIFNEIGKEYPELEKEHWIIDIGAARIADTPEIFDVLVTTNLYGDIISDITAQIAGSVGLCGSVNLGEKCAMFEAIHGSAPDIAGKGIANPSGLLQGAVMMLNHIGQNNVATDIQNAWLTTIEQGIHTGDIYTDGKSKQKVNTPEFTEAVIGNIGQIPTVLKPVEYPEGQIQLKKYQRPTPAEKKLVGVDVFLDWKGDDPERLAKLALKLNTTSLSLEIITNRGVKVWPDGFSETFCSDHWRCRYLTDEQAEVRGTEIVEILSRAIDAKLDIIKTENLYFFDDRKGFSMGQGQ